MTTKVENCLCGAELYDDGILEGLTWKHPESNFCFMDRKEVHIEKVSRWNYLMLRAREDAQKENLRLRAALARSKDPCIYCQLPAEDMAKCKDGFPGCPKMDDLIAGCPEFGAMMNLDDTVREFKSHLEVIKQQVRLIEVQEMGVGGNFTDKEIADSMRRLSQNLSTYLNAIKIGNTE